MTYRFSRFKLYRDIGGGKAAANSTRSQIRKAQLRYQDTGYFEIGVTAERRSTVTYRFDGTLLATRGSMLGTADTGNDVNWLYSGVFDIPIQSKGDNCIVEIHNPTPHPCKFSTCEWTGLITAKARSLQ
jgi:hypothetical protein